MNCSVWSLICFKLLQLVTLFACFSGHYASFKAPDLYHKGCHLHRCDLDHGYLLLAPTCYLSEIVHLQVQVRGISRSSLGFSGDCPSLHSPESTGSPGKGKLEAPRDPQLSELPIPASLSHDPGLSPILLLPDPCLFFAPHPLLSFFLLNHFSFLLVVFPISLQGSGSSYQILPPGGVCSHRLRWESTAPGLK